MPGLKKLTRIRIDMNRYSVDHYLEDVLAEETLGRKRIDLSWYRIGTVGQNIDNVLSAISDDVKELDLSYNLLNQLTSEAFEYLPLHLTYLCLAGNEFTQKDVEGFLPIITKRNLATLDLSDNPEINSNKLLEVLNAHPRKLTEVILSNGSLISVNGRFVKSEPAPAAPTDVEKSEAKVEFSM